MSANIHRDALSAWIFLREAGGLDVDERDEDLVQAIRREIAPNAGDLESALAGLPPERLLRALFNSIAPFVGMFRDILAFFEQANAREGQSQWRLSVGEEFLDLEHFEEFLEHWERIEANIEVPALDFRGAWLLNNVRREVGWEYLLDGMESGRLSAVGIPDVDAWLSADFAGRFEPFPSSLAPENFPAGLADMANVVLAVLTILREGTPSRAQMMEDYHARRHKMVESDAFHPWTIAQNETDYWLRSNIIYLANLLRASDEERQDMDVRMAKAFSAFPRRRLPLRVDIAELEHLLSLPVWKQRYETYGVWIATRILAAIDDHDIAFHVPDGALKFAFRETKIADIDSARPRLTLYSERRVALADPVGKSRKEGAQPDYSLWTRDEPAACVLVVEVKHYKKRSRRNFHDALEDYARAHPEAKVVLVNYGPVGAEFDDLAARFGDRCRLLGNLLPGNAAALTEFREIVRSRVGDRVFPVTGDNGAAGASHAIAIDVSASMRDAIRSAAFQTWLAALPPEQGQIALIDMTVRAAVAPEAFAHWLEQHGMGTSTSLTGPLAELLERFAEVIVVTDEEGIESLAGLNIEPMPSLGGDIVMARVTR